MALMVSHSLTHTHSYEVAACIWKGGSAFLLMFLGFKDVGEPIYIPFVIISEVVNALSTLMAFTEGEAWMGGWMDVLTLFVLMGRERTKAMF